MKRLTNHIIPFVLALSLVAGCSDWLDVQPTGTAEADVMFRNEEGYMHALTGTYLLLCDKAAYGRELTVGFPEEIMHNWQQTSLFYKWNYTDVSTRVRLDSTWAKMYQAVANINLILGHLDKSDPAGFRHYDLIRGEALGLRAYIHLDLLRLYGPVLNGGLKVKSIPYRETFSNELVRRQDADVVLGKIERDLLEAYDLLADDPIQVNGRKNTPNENSPELLDNSPEAVNLATDYRAIRMNRYAVCATLARCYMLKGDKANAAKYAGEVIAATDIFGLLVKDVDISQNTPDLMFSRELVWGLYDRATQNKIGESLAYGSIQADEEYKVEVYTGADGYGSAEDLRSIYLWERSTLITPSVYIYKRYPRILNTEKRDITKWDPVIPMIRLTEMYYIAAEANLGTDNAETFRLLTQVRASRNLGISNVPLPETIKNNTEELTRQIIREYHKDFWGEGKLFYAYKHFFRDCKVRGQTITASRGVYELPIPDAEIEHGGN